MKLLLYYEDLLEYPAREIHKTRNLPRSRREANRSSSRESLNIKRSRSVLTRQEGTCRPQLATHALSHSMHRRTSLRHNGANSTSLPSPVPSPLRAVPQSIFVLEVIVIRPRSLGQRRLECLPDASTGQVAELSQVQVSSSVHNPKLGIGFDVSELDCFAFIVGCPDQGRPCCEQCSILTPIWQFQASPISLFQWQGSGADTNRERVSARISLFKTLMNTNGFEDGPYPLKQSSIGSIPQAPTTPSAIRATYSAYAKEQSKRLYGDKTPSYVLQLPLISSLFPEARFVHIVRDGRDVAASISDVHFGPSTIPNQRITGNPTLLQVGPQPPTWARTGTWKSSTRTLSRNLARFLSMYVPSLTSASPNRC